MSFLGCPHCGSFNCEPLPPNLSQDLAEPLDLRWECQECRTQFSHPTSIPHFTTPAHRPSTFIKLTNLFNDEAIWIRFALITSIATINKGSAVWVVDKYVDVRETPEQIISLIDSASPSQGCSDAPPA